MPTGIVKWFNSGQGYGFIREKNGYRAIFVHRADIIENKFGSLKEGDCVAFDIEQRHTGPTAVNVMPAKPGIEP